MTQRRKASLFWKKVGRKLGKETEFALKRKDRREYLPNEIHPGSYAIRDPSLLGEEKAIDVKKLDKNILVKKICDVFWMHWFPNTLVFK